MRRIILLAGLALSAMPLLPQAAEARPPWERGWEDRRDWDRREAWREERWRREAWRREAARREAWREERWRRHNAYAPPMAYAPPAPGVTLQFNLR
ncbi:hypothetical protein D9599_22230 [Roseomonas sp. KE2513]|uniref:hypothetical protein n=1 Tax=Roseomonas sp. KE2513 TaxID=2479202 RepID=UPI0018DFEB20|nr:hypothetical protein [Roseomonas sp. KE2513]MBI0538287.1 hypothetical protein [Roseomonas sp. KE2513]